jgi:PAS domain S-box-containing protein/putative nucleotidyltransferase with HDIG domain
VITPKASPDRPADLRRRAQARLKSRTAGLEKISPEEARNLVQELHIHQMELEMQNEQLRQTHAELETALTKYTDLYDFAPVAYFTLDDRGWVLEANLTASRLLGTERSRLLQQPLAPFIRPEDIKQFWAYLVAVVHGQPTPPLELTLLGKGGAEVAIQLDSLLVPDAAGHPQVRTSLIDITARRRAEESLKNQMHFTETLLETIPSPVFYKDASGRYLGCNRAFEEFWGKRREEVIGKDVYEMGPKEVADKYAEMDQELFERPGRQIYEWQVRAADGSQKEVVFHKASFLDAAGKVGGLIGVILDITDRKRAEEALKESLARTTEVQYATIEALAMVTAARDPYTAGHQRRVTQLACAVARELGLPADRVAGLRVMGLLHDLGKITIPIEILSKPGKLSDAEFGLIKSHAQAGYEIVKEIRFPWPVAEAILQHHERMDGSGYPAGLTAEEITPEAKILAVADVVEAMASHRPYRSALGIEKALEEVSRNRSILYDPEVVDVCVKLFTDKTFQFD